MTSAVDWMLNSPQTETKLKKEGDKALKLEREYKYKIVDLLARTLHPGWYDPKENYSPDARKTLQSMAEVNAKRGLRAIAEYIKEPY